MKILPVFLICNWLLAVPFSIHSLVLQLWKLPKTKKNGHTHFITNLNRPCIQSNASWKAIIGDSAEGGLTQFWELITVIRCAPKYLNVNNIVTWRKLVRKLKIWLNKEILWLQRYLETFSLSDYQALPSKPARIKS